MCLVCLLVTGPFSPPLPNLINYVMRELLKQDERERRQWIIGTEIRLAWWRGPDQNGWTFTSLTLKDLYLKILRNNLNLFLSLYLFDGSLVFQSPLIISTFYSVHSSYLTYLERPILRHKCTLLWPLSSSVKSKTSVNLQKDSSDLK